MSTVGRLRSCAALSGAVLALGFVVGAAGQASGVRLPGPASFSQLGVAAPTIGKFLPPRCRATMVRQVDLDGSAVPQVVVTAVGPLAKAAHGFPSFHTSTVMLLVWDPGAKRWAEAFDAARQPSYQASGMAGPVGPGLVELGGTGPAVAVMHDQLGDKADLVYWDMSIGGNSGRLLMGIVHLQRQTAHLVWDYGQDLAHTQLATPNPRVIGESPHQELEVSAPWETSTDNRSYAVRLFSYVVALTSLRAGGLPGYRVVSDDQPWVGVGLQVTSWGSPAVVRYVFPRSPANGALRKGDTIEGVRGAPPARFAKALAAPVVDQVALFRPGDTITFDIKRAGRPMVVAVTLGEWPFGGPSEPARMYWLLM